MSGKEASTDKTQLDNAFREPFETFTEWLASDTERIDAALKKQMNDGIIADVFGEASTPVNRRTSREDKLRARFGYALMSLLSSVYRLERIKKMLKHFPGKRSGISKGAHLENCTIVLFNEIYVTEERLKGFLEECQAIEIELCGSSSIKPGRAVRIYHSTFRGFLAARGTHTHRSDFEDPKIKRIQLIEMLMISKDFQLLAPILRQATNEAQRFWFRKIDEVEEAAKTVLVMTFEQVRSLSHLLFADAVGSKTKTRNRGSRRRTSRRPSAPR